MSKLLMKNTRRSFVFTSSPDSRSRSAEQNTRRVVQLHVHRFNNRNLAVPIISVRMRLTSCAIMLSPPPPIVSACSAATAAALAPGETAALPVPPAPLCRVITEQISCA
jgi:hypothetical protein